MPQLTEPGANEPALPALSPAEHVSAVLDGLGLAGIFERMEIAEEEIAAARERHPDADDSLYHSFGLLTQTFERMEYELVYRSHCRELLDRVAAGADTRPGSAAEICCMMLEVSQIAPLTSVSSGLYMRAFRAAGLPTFPELVDASEHHEGLEATRIDDHERETRSKLAVPTRTLATVECHGLHHGEQVDCVYSTENGTDAEAPTPEARS